MARIAVILLLLVIAGGCDRTPPLADLSGRAVDPLAPGDDVLVLLFARTDCPISNRYAPEVRRLIETFEPRGVTFLLVYPDPKTDVAAATKHRDGYGYPCRAVRDPDHRLVAATGATVTPEAVVYTPDRTMTYRGRIDDWFVEFGRARAEPTTRDLVDALERTLAGEPVDPARTTPIGCYIVGTPEAAE